MNIYEKVIKKDMPILIRQLKNVKSSGVFHDEEREILEKFLNDRLIKGSAELVEKINDEIQKELPNLPFLYAKTYAQYEEQLGREPIDLENELM